jgi:hypothetical protein
MTEPDPTPAPEPVHEPVHQPVQPAVANPFVPRYREPWVNPAKRTPAIVLGLAGAVVLLAVGFLLGLGLGGGHGHRHGEFRDRPGAGRFYPEHGSPYGPRGRGWAGSPHGHMPLPRPPRSVPTAVPTPVPTSSPS